MSDDVLVIETLLSNHVDTSGDPPPSVNLGPVVLSVDEIKTGLATILIVFIPNIIVILLFKYAGPKKNPYEREFDIKEEEEDTGNDYSIIFYSLLKVIYFLNKTLGKVQIHVYIIVDV